MCEKYNKWYTFPFFFSLWKGYFFFVRKVIIYYLYTKYKYKKKSDEKKKVVKIYKVNDIYKGFFWTYIYFFFFLQWCSSNAVTFRIIRSTESFIIINNIRFICCQEMCSISIVCSTVIEPCRSGFTSSSSFSWCRCCWNILFVLDYSYCFFLLLLATFLFVGSNIYIIYFKWIVTIFMRIIGLITFNGHVGTPFSISTDSPHSDLSFHFINDIDIDHIVI